MASSASDAANKANTLSEDGKSELEFVFENRLAICMSYCN